MWPWPGVWVPWRERRFYRPCVPEPKVSGKGALWGGLWEAAASRTDRSAVGINVIVITMATGLCVDREPPQQVMRTPVWVRCHQLEGACHMSQRRKERAFMSAFSEMSVLIKQQSPLEINGCCFKKNIKNHKNHKNPYMSTKYIWGCWD